MKSKFALLLLPIIGFVLTGCMKVHEARHDAIRTIVTGHPGGAFAPVNTTRYDLENRESFVLLDRQTQRAVTVSGIQERIHEDGRLEVIANVRNRRNRRVDVQINCVFKDAHGFPTGDQTPFQTLILRPYAQEGIRFISMNDQARLFTIRAGQPQ